MAAKEDNGARIKSAASILLKGGTLVSEPCEKCGGVQVRFADKVSCINCGNESGKKETPAAGAPAATVAKQPEVSPPSALPSSAAAAAIEAKITALAQELKDERDTAVQKEKASLLETYLRILEKMRALQLG
ncbi:Sjogren's syndrome/scleroderma autoantigen 1 family protein [Nitrososphaera sp.]|uniref:Sjogren's syndrome/scleroderma autoantigen 1 family protein n=1 Tax=Nitrososphaera sp. TaxID=1971748 RepID=UPI00307E09A4